MWMRFVRSLRCPLCTSELHLEPFECSRVEVTPEAVVRARELGVYDDRFDQYVESGLLVCKPCQVKFPVIDGLPILLCYTTPMHATFDERYAARPQTRFAGYAFPEREPISGERAVMRSFSKEWLDYDYDGVIWEMSYDDHERRFLSEIGAAMTERQGQRFLEVGCGLGITTFLAHRNLGGDAVGLDLSLAVWKACRHYRDNPFLHFVQASAFAMPFAKASFDLIYSRGVLHHTYSTERAFESTAPLCRPGGTLYLWVYGIGSIRETLFRRMLYGMERAFRPALSAAPNSGAAKAFLSAMGVGYLAFNGLRRTINPEIQPLTLARGVHAARDRFTPQYAHRHDADEVAGWFRRAGFVETQIVDWKTMPAADHDDFRRNVGVRGKLLRSFPA